ncbi:hypothetical protein EV361DRAFT_956396 [Lentinula raphanica]|nr:hypothetical protein EV361DRAFT_956396 [Lentinula raphanica]
MSASDLAIQLLRFTGKGNINNNAKTPRLIPGKVDSEDMTLRQIVTNTSDYAIPKYAVTNSKKFLLHTIIRSSNVALDINLSKKSLGSDNTTRRHFCISKRIFGIFRSDSDAHVDRGFRALDEDEIELGCREENSDDEDAREVRVIAQMLQPPSATPGAFIENSRVRSNFSAETTQQNELGILWDDDEESSTQTDDPDNVFYGWERSRIFKIIGDRYREVLGLEPSGFMLKGETPEMILVEYTALVRRAIEEEDFSTLLSDVRHFQLVADDNGVERYVTSGPGLEKEVMNLFYKENLDAHLNTFMVELIDDYTTLSTVPLSPFAEVLPSKLYDLTFFGSVVGLALVHGHYPGNISPLLLIYLLNSSNLKLITKDLVMEVFPSLYRTLTRWNALAHTDNDLDYFQPHFATYHNLQVPALYGRSESLHRSLAWTMLHNAVVGPVAIDHPYFQAFYRGLMLPCKSISLNLPDVASNFCGGINEFVLSLQETRITGDYEALRLEHTDRTSATTRIALSNAIEQAVPDWAGSGFSVIFREFLEGRGLPCPSLMEELRGRFNESIPLEKASEKGFRMKMFCWAATGSPQIFLEGSPIEVSLVDDTDSTYFSLQSTRAAERALLLSHGTIGFKTCTRDMYVPASHLLKLLQNPYDGVSEPRNAKESIFHWLLYEILNGIGNYNVT